MTSGSAIPPTETSDPTLAPRRGSHPTPDSASVHPRGPRPDAAENRRNLGSPGPVPGMLIETAAVLLAPPLFLAFCGRRPVAREAAPWFPGIAVAAIFVAGVPGDARR